MTRVICVAVVVLAASAVFGQEQRREVKWNNPDGPVIPGVEHRSFHSESMDVEVGYNVSLPKGYKEGDRRYPVIYFLHGAGGNENSDAGGFSGMVAGLIEAKKIEPVICVFPNGGMSGYRDRPDEKVMGETLIIKELIPLVDGQYRTIAKPEGRTIGGFSMGGGGAVRLALKHPELFSAAASWAGAFRLRGEDPNYRVERLETIRDKVRLLMIVGSEDQTLESHGPLRERLEQAKFPAEYQELPDVGHDLGKYYQLTGEKLVTFLASGFAKLSSN